MKLEQQVCSLELAKKLKELGVKQESLFYYSTEDGKIKYGFRSHVDRSGLMVWDISAFTDAELGDLLPKDIWHGDKRYFLGLDYFSDEWTVGYYHHERTPAGFDETQPETKCEAETEADARAKMLCYLIENKLITL